MEGKDGREWWKLARSRPAMYRKMEGLRRYIATPRVAKHRLFTFVDATVVPDCRLYAIVRDDSTAFGILHSRIHEVWSLATSSRHGVGNDPTYNAESCFETFPFPVGLSLDVPAVDYAQDERAVAIAAAAEALDSARMRWLHPPEWIDWHQTPEEKAAGFPPRPVPRAGHEVDIRQRTLTQLYNLRPAWLQGCHADLDAAVARAYGWEWPISDSELLHRLVILNGRASVR